MSDEQGIAKCSAHAAFPVAPGFYHVTDIKRIQPSAALRFTGAHQRGNFRAPSTWAAAHVAGRRRLHIDVRLVLTVP